MKKAVRHPSFAFLGTQSSDSVFHPWFSLLLVRYIFQPIFLLLNIFNCGRFQEYYRAYHRKSHSEEYSLCLISVFRSDSTFKNSFEEKDTVCYRNDDMFWLQANTWSSFMILCQWTLFLVREKKTKQKFW